MKLVYPLAILAIGLPLACAPPGNAPKLDAMQTGMPPKQAPELPSNRIAIPATVRKNLGLSFAPVEVRRVAQTLRVPGAFELEPRARQEYHMSLEGTVELLVDQYQRVEVGQVLFRFRSSAWPELLHEIINAEQSIETELAQIELMEARIEEHQAQLALLDERIRVLRESDFVRADLGVQAESLRTSTPRLEAEMKLVQTRLQNARRTREHALHRAAAAARIAETELDKWVEFEGKRVHAYETIEWVEVLTREAGVVESLAVTHGSFVEPGHLVLTVVDPDQVRFRGFALQGDLSRLSATSGGWIVPPQTPGLPIERGVQATLTLSLEAHPKERTMTLLAKPMELAPWIRPGVAAFLELQTQTSDGPALAIPRAAVVRDGMQHIFFRLDPKDSNLVIREKADLGVSDGRWVVLNSGVSRKDKVVLDGVYELKLASEQNGTSQAGGHFHADGSFHQE